MVHTLRLDNYSPTPRKLVLGTNSSYGTESIKIERGAGWDGLNLTATWHIPGREEPLRVALLDGDAMDVPPEVTKEAKDGVLVLAGLASGVQRASCNVEYLILEQAGIYGGTDAEPTPELAAQVIEAALQAKADAEAAAEDAAAAKANADKAKADAEKAQQAAENAAADAAKAGPYAEAARAAQEAAESARDEAIAAQQAAENAAAAAAASKSAADTLAAEAARAAQAAENSKAAANNAANLAGENATAAQQAAATATAAANDAGQSASDAATSKAAAETAAKAAQDAKTAAAAAKAEGVKAQEAAQTAAKSAQDAQTAAEKARDEAKAAQKGAEAARDAAAKSAEAAAKSEANAKQSADTLAESLKNITPDDSSIGDKPWSSKHIIDMLCPPLEESGNPVVCYPVAGYPLGVKASWEPMQEGTGTPSPENIRPIKGRDSVKVKRCGENLLNINSFNKFTVNGITYEYVPDGGIHVSGTATSNTSSQTFPVWHLPTGTYHGLDAGEGILSFLVVHRNGKDLWLTAKGIFEILAGDVTMYWYMVTISGTTVDKTVYPYIVPGTTAPTTYKPYIGQTATLTLPETVYGGEVDAVTGEGQETWETLTLDGTEGWAIRDTFIGVYNLLSPTDNGKGICTHFNVKRSYSGDCIIIEKNGTVYLGHALSDKYTVDTWRAYLAAQNAAGTPVQITYKLAEPVPFTATGAQPIPALAGANTVLTDADSATVTGRADPIKSIEDLEAAVASIN